MWCLIGYLCMTNTNVFPLMHLLAYLFTSVERYWIAVKNLKIFFRNFFTLTNLKLLVNCYSLSVLTGPTWFILQLKFLWLAVLCSNYWLYDFNDKRFQFFLKFLWVLLFYWLLLNSYHIIRTLYTISIQILF